MVDRETRVLRNALKMSLFNVSDDQAWSGGETNLLHQYTSRTTASNRNIDWRWMRSLADVYRAVIRCIDLESAS